MRITILISLSLLGIPLYRLQKNKGKATAIGHFYSFESIDTSRYAILKFDSRQNYYFDKDVKPTTLTAEEIEKIEGLIDQRVSQYNKAEEAIYKKNSSKLKKRQPNAIAYDNKIKNPRKYYKQFMAVVNAKGEKIVWANCFCSAENLPYWRTSEVLVMDGGSCYFNLKINLTRAIVYDLMVNGVA